MVRMPDGQEVETRWAIAPQFAEVAEALNVRTDQIMAMGTNLPGVPPERGTFHVLYTPVSGEPVRVYAATLKRDADHVLVLFGQPIELPGYWEALTRRLEEELPRRFGEPGR